MSEINENTKKGGISVDRDHIFPIIKKWLYSEKDIFLREIVSNAADAVTKLKRLSSLGQYDGNGEAYAIHVTLDKEAKTLTVSDNGIGMTEEEVQKYICQIALSGAIDFVSKYENTADSSTANTGIIGHFGLGFYSAFMVSDNVELETRSYTGTPAVHWTCKESGEYEIEAGDREGHGTDVIMHITDEESAYLEKFKISEMLEKYCSFMPVEIYFDVEGEEKPAEDDKSADKKEEKKPEAPKPINDTMPLWLKAPKDCTEEEYTEFYRKVFHDYKEPLFHIHINADYPLNFKGILYFPRLGNEYESLEGQVKLYYNQVFVADNIKEVIPEYLLMLKGVLDCPELPLNVSRSYLQNNSYVTKVSAHIVKKVADKLNELCTSDRKKYETVYKDIRTFVEYACIRDKKFYDKVKDSMLLELTDGTFMTLKEYTEDAKEKHAGVVYYTTDKALQSQYISLFEAQGIKVAVFDEKPLDTQFISTMESYETDLKYSRIDAEVTNALKSEETAEENKDLVQLFTDVVANEKTKVELGALKDTAVPALLTVSEQSRRMEQMMKYYNMGGTEAFPIEETLTLNANSPLIKRVSELLASDHDRAAEIAKEIYGLATISQRKLSADELKAFLADTYKLLSLF